MKKIKRAATFFLQDTFPFEIAEKPSVIRDRHSCLSLYWMSHPRLLFLQSLPKSARLLDLGMANGGMANVRTSLDPPRPDIRLYGIDLRKHEPNYYHLYQKVAFLDFESDPLPFREDFFDGIIASHFLEHLHDAGRFLERIISLLSEGGRLYIETPSPVSLVLPHGREFTRNGLSVRLASFWKDGTHCAVPNFSDLEQAALREGFITIQRGFTSNPYIENDLISPGFHEQDEEIATYGFWSTVLWCRFLILQKPNHLQHFLLSLTPKATPSVRAQWDSPTYRRKTNSSDKSTERSTGESAGGTLQVRTSNDSHFSMPAPCIGVRLFILDQNLSSLQGHHLSYSSLLSQAGQEEGIEAFVVANMNVTIDSPNARLIPALKHSYWQELSPVENVPPLQHLTARATDFEATLLELASQFSWAGRDVLFLPYANMIHPFALRRLHDALAPNIPRTVLLFRRELWEQAAHARMPVRDGELTLTVSLSYLFAGPGASKVRLFSDSDVLTRDYMAHVGHLFQTAPIPVHPELTAREPKQREVPLNLVYVGDARTEKGFHLLPKIAQHFNTELQAGTIQLIVQSNFNVPGGEPGVAEAREQLAAFPNVHLVPGPLDVVAYNDLITSAHIILLPYRGQDYHARTSGILAEAIHAAAPVVVPKATWLSDQLANNGAGLTFLSGNPEDLCQALDELIAQYEKFSERAFLRRSAFLAFHNPSRLLKFVCGSDLLHR